MNDNFEIVALAASAGGLMALGRVLAGGGKVEHMNLSAVNRRGKKIQVRMTGTPLGSAKQEPVGAIMVIQEEQLEAV